MIAEPNRLGIMIIPPMGHQKGVWFPLQGLHLFPHLKRGFAQTDSPESVFSSSLPSFRGEEREERAGQGEESRGGV